MRRALDTLLLFGLLVLAAGFMSGALLALLWAFITLLLGFAR